MIGVLSLFLLFVALIDRSLGEVKANDQQQQVHQYSKSLGLLYSQNIQRCWETASQQAPYPPPIILPLDQGLAWGSSNHKSLLPVRGPLEGSRIAIWASWEPSWKRPGRLSNFGTWNRPHTKAWLRCMIAYHDYHQILTHIYLYTCTYILNCRVSTTQKFHSPIAANPPIFRQLSPLRFHGHSSASRMVDFGLLKRL